MNRIFDDHIKSKFIERVEYRPIREAGKPIDFLIRFFPGSVAKESVSRVASLITRKRKPPAGEPRTPRNTNLQPTPAITEGEDPRSRVEPPRENTEASFGKIEPHAALVEALTKRGIFRSQANKLLSNLQTHELENVPRYIEYWDALKKIKPVGEGLLYELIRNGDALPATFETTQQKEERRTAEAKRLALIEAERSRRAAYAEFCRKTEKEFVAAFPSAELARRIEQHKQTLLESGGFWSDKPDKAEQLAGHTVRAEISKFATRLSYEEFCRMESASEIRESETTNLPETQAIDAADLSEALPNTLYAPPTIDPIKDEGSAISEENSPLNAV